MDFYHQICLSHTDFIYSVSVVQYLTSIIVVGRINIYLFIYLLFTFILMQGISSVHSISNKALLLYSTFPTHAKHFLCSFILMQGFSHVNSYSCKALLLYIHTPARHFFCTFILLQGTSSVL